VQLIYDQRFIDAFVEIRHYIAKDSANRAHDFERELKSKIETLISMPYRYRQSIYFNQKNIRDYVFKGYTIPYMVDEECDMIVVLDIFKWTNQERKT